MGYCGLKTFQDSDSSADFAYGVIENLEKMMLKEMKHKGNSFNTDGMINVALFAESFVLPLISNNQARMALHPLYDFFESLESKLYDLVNQTMHESAEKWNGTKNRNWHLKNYRRMYKNISKIVKAL